MDEKLLQIYINRMNEKIGEYAKGEVILLSQIDVLLQTVNEQKNKIEEFEKDIIGYKEQLGDLLTDNEILTDRLSRITVFKEPVFDEQA